MELQGIHLSKSHHQDHFPAWLENVIILVIVLVIAQTILDDVAVAFHWSHDVRQQLVLAGFFFDLFFTAEFLARSVVSARTTGFGDYIKHQRGWVDCLSSVPLLFLVSGPAVALILLGAEQDTLGLGFFSVLKTAKAIRVTRILRLIRVIKLFGRIQNTDSVMTGRHVGTVSTISVVALILVMVIVEFVPGLRFGNHAEYSARRQAELTAFLGAKTAPSNELIKTYFGMNPASEDVIRIRKGKDILYESPSAAELHFTSFDQKLAIGTYEAELSYHPADIEHARANLLVLIGILFVIGALMLVYTPIFARQIADPVFIMDRGLREMEYNLEVKLDSHNKQDEVFRLARAYNVRWLPLKNQILNYRKSHQDDRSVLSMKDLL